LVFVTAETIPYSLWLNPNKVSSGCGGGGRTSAHTSANRGKAIPTDGELTGGKVLPGFALKLSDLFAATKRPPKK